MSFFSIKKIALTFSSVAFSLSIAACGSDSSSASDETDDEEYSSAASSSSKKDSGTKSSASKEKSSSSVESSSAVASSSSAKDVVNDKMDWTGNDESVYDSTKNTLKDLRNNKTYKTVVIGTDIWMAENLSINFDEDKRQITCYGDDADNCTQYGRLYSFAAATDAAKNFTSKNSNVVRGACPVGWHIPTEAEFNNAKGNSEMVGNYNILKSEEGWATTAMPGISNSRNGFNALPGGYYNGTSFDGLGSATFFWGVNGTKATNLLVGGISYGVSGLDADNGMAYVRCVYDTKRVDPDADPYIWEKSSMYTDEIASVIIGSQQWIAKDMGYRTWSESGGCPADIGYHLATLDDWNKLLTYVTDVRALKSKSSWNKKDGTDSYKFTLTASGAYNYTEDAGSGLITYTDVYSVGLSAVIWTSTKSSDDEAYYIEFSDGKNRADIRIANVKHKMGTRCVKDYPADPGSSSADPVDNTPKFGSIIDKRDSTEYKTVTIGKQTWMAENLNFEYNNGSAKSSCYDDDPENCEKYGRLYSWMAAIDSAGDFGSAKTGCTTKAICDLKKIQGICPEGFRLPDSDEWDTLRALVDKSDTLSLVLRSTSDWSEERFNGTDEFGMNILPAGMFISGEYTGLGEKARFWTTYDNMKAAISSGSAGVRAARFEDYSAAASDFIGVSKASMISVRCVK